MFTLAHLSDPHLTPVPPAPWMAFANKRITGYVNWWLRRQRLHDMRVLDAILADIAACGPDHVAMTGDLCHVGLAEEFEAARGFMARLGTPERVSFVPGNHDAYVAGALEDCLARFSGFAASDDQAAGFPFLRVRGPLALIGLSSAVPTLPFFATGALGQPQIDRAEALLDYARARGLIRVILVHHAPHAGGAKPLRQLTDAAAIEAMLARTGLILFCMATITAPASLSARGRRGPCPSSALLRLPARMMAAMSPPPGISSGSRPARRSRSAWSAAALPKPELR